MAHAILPPIDLALDGPQLHHLSALEGPWLTTLLPAYRKGEPQNPDSLRLKTLLRNAAASRIPDHLFAPFRELAESEALASGGKGVALFSGRDFAGGYRVDSALGDKLVFSKHPFVKPLLAEAVIPNEAFALGLSRKRMRLFRYRSGSAGEMPFPTRVPSNMQAALDTDQPDHLLANRSASGSSTGSNFAVRFGTSSEQETAPEYLHQFFTVVDHGLHPAIKAGPLYLMGVAEEIAVYRKVSGHPNILQSEFDGSAENRPLDEIAKHLRTALMAEYQRQAARVLQEFHEMTNRSRVAQGLQDVPPAAKQGRVHQAVIAEDVYVPAAHAGRNDHFEGDDLLNMIAVETLRAGGQVFTLPEDQMGDAGPVAAILRY